MRLCFLCDISHPHSRRWVELAADEGHEIFVLTDATASYTYPGVNVLRPEMGLPTKALAFKIVRSKYSNNYFKVFPYRRMLRKIRPDVIHAIEVLNYGFPMAHSGDFPKLLTPWGEILMEPRASFLRWQLFRSSLKGANLITTNLFGLKEVLNRDFGVPPEKVEEFSWGIDLDVFNRGHEEEGRLLREEWGIDASVPIFLSPRNLGEWWGIETIVDAIPKVLRQAPEAVFVFLRGRSRERDFEERMKHCLQDSAAAQHIRFIERFLSPPEMAAAFSTATAFISVPRTDLLALTLLEGMACGCVPIVADLAAYRCRIIHGQNGWVVPQDNAAELADRCVHVLSHPEERDPFAARNREIVTREDDARKNGRKMLALYERLRQEKRSFFC